MLVIRHFIYDRSYTNRQVFLLKDVSKTLDNKAIHPKTRNAKNLNFFHISKALEIL